MQKPHFQPCLRRCQTVVNGRAGRIYRHGYAVSQKFHTLVLCVPVHGTV